MSNANGGMERAVHGAMDYAELARLGLQPEEILDFSVNSNPYFQYPQAGRKGVQAPAASHKGEYTDETRRGQVELHYGPSPRVREALVSVVLERYPDRESLQLRQTILERELASTQLSLSSILCGNGTSELIWTIARTYLKVGDRAAIIGPTFGEYAAACRAVGATIVEARSSIEKSFQHSSEELGAWIRSEQPRIVWLCNPNNPTGTWLNRSQILPILKACRHADAWLVIDEAYQKFLVPAEPYSTVELLETVPAARVIVLRSLTKDYALAAARLGYLVSSAESVAQLSLQLPAWNVSGFAQAAGVAALNDQEYLNAMLQQLVVERNAFFQALGRIGLPAIPSRTHFCLLDVRDACRVRQQLLARKMLVRDCTSFGLPQYIRVATRPAADWQQLLSVLQEVAI
ncbi:MAG: histidinol-phosphate aminotransferase family protein [Chloroflexota bacterium]|nr:histidinol-phosphate aminotransferase family protein [Chloroflexota bacterium]